MLTPEKLKEVETRLKQDMEWCAQQGVPWNPDKPARYTSALEDYGACGVCALGAHALRACTERQIDIPPRNVPLAADDLGVPCAFATSVFQSVMYTDENKDLAIIRGFYDKQAWELSRELRRFGECLNQHVNKK